MQKYMPKDGVFYCRLKVLWLKPEGILGVEGYVDAAFAPHADSKSHMGVAIFI